MAINSNHKVEWEYDPGSEFYRWISWRWAVVIAIVCAVVVWQINPPDYNRFMLTANVFISGGCLFYWGVWSTKQIIRYMDQTTSSRISTNAYPREIVVKFRKDTELQWRLFWLNMITIVAVFAAIVISGQVMVLFGFGMALAGMTVYYGSLLLNRS